MLTLRIQKYVAITLIAILTCSSCTNERTFVVADIIAPDYISEEAVQEARKRLIGTEVNLLFSDNDVRMTIKPIKGEKAESTILQKIGNNLYRKEDGSGDVVDLELNTILGYIRLCKITSYDKKRSGSSMVWSGTIILKRNNSKVL